MTKIIIKRESDGSYVNIESGSEPVFVLRDEATEFNDIFNAEYIAELFRDKLGNYILENL